MAETYLTRPGLEKLRKELGELKAERVRLAHEISEAASQGDLKENGGYQSAKERQAVVHHQIADLEKKLLSVRLIEEMNIPQGEIRVGTKATLEEVPTKEQAQWQFVGADEADFDQGKISVHAPLAQGLLGHKEGETVTIQLPAKTITYKIIKVERI